MHLGRTPHRLRDGGVPLEGLGPGEAWRRVVDGAIADGAQAVVLAGDVVDQDKDRFEAWGHLYRGCARLLRAGVRVIAVAGNHDHLALPRLTERLDGVHLLGAGGRWERVSLDGVDLVGWSFPARHHPHDPLSSPGRGAAMVEGPDRPLTLGVLHADLDASSSVYAPVRRADLEAQPVDAWLLGHIHQPADLTARRPIGYLGSVVGLDRSEVGPRGPWRVEVAGGAVRAAQQVVGPVGWDEVDVDLSAVRPGEDVVDQVHVAVHRALQAHADASPWLAGGALRAVGVTVRWTGRVEVPDGAARFEREVPASARWFDVAGARWGVIAFDDRSRPARDLAALAEARTPVGRLARLLQEVDAGGAEAVPSAIQEAIERFDPVPWAHDPARDPLPPPEVLVAKLGRAVLEELLAQVEERS